MAQPADLRGRHCLITGCSSGIGRATAVALAVAGARVFASARDVCAIADLAAPGVSLLELDVTDRFAVDRAVAEAAPVDIVVNNAGDGLEGAIEEIDDDELRAQ